MGRYDELIEQGWERRATYDEPRLSEMVEMYEELGFEVLQEPVDFDACGDCSECMKEQPERFRTIFTRRLR